MANEVKILQTVINIHEQLGFLIKRMSSIEEKIGSLTSNQHRHNLYWLEYSDKIRGLISAQDFRIMRDEIVNGQDKMMGLLKHIDTERLALVARMDKMEVIIDEQKLK